MNQVLFFALAVGLVVVIELAARVRSHVGHIRRTKRVSEALDRLDHDEHLDHGRLQLLLDRHRIWVSRITMCTSEPERDAVTRLAQAELGPPAEALNRPDYDCIRRIKLENLIDFDPQLRRRLVSAVNAQVRLDRWRTDSHSRSRQPSTADAPRPS